jgi:hypothetical protein
VLLKQMHRKCCRAVWDSWQVEEDEVVEAWEEEDEAEVEVAALKQQPYSCRGRLPRSLQTGCYRMSIVMQAGWRGPRGQPSSPSTEVQGVSRRG